MIYKVKVESECYTMCGNFRGDSQTDCIRKAVKEWRRRIEREGDIDTAESPNAVIAWLIA